LEFNDIHLSDRAGKSDRRTINQDVEAAKRIDSLVNGPLDSHRIGTIGRNGNCKAAQLPDRSDDAVRALGGVLVRDRNVRAVLGQSLRNRGTDAPGPACYKRALAFEIAHDSSSLAMAVEGPHAGPKN